jgi:uncharacterized protein (DUF1697 family)
MTHYVAFLRGINVGGNAKVNMKDLVVLFEALGFSKVSTYVNSGNVIFEAPAADHQKVIEEALEKKLGFKIRVMVKTKEELEQVVEANPFAGETIGNDRTLFVSFCFDQISPETQEVIKTLSNPNELLEPRLHEVYTLLVRGHFPDSFMGKSKLLKQFKIDSTTRNWNTLTTVISKM